MTTPPQDPPAPPKTLHEALKRVDWERAYERVFRFALTRTRVRQDAEDLTQEAMAGVMKGLPWPWDWKKYPNIELHLVLVAKQLCANKRAADRRRRDPKWIAIARAESARPVRAPDQELARRVRIEGGYRRWDELRASFQKEGKELEMRVLDELAKRVTDAHEQARAIGIAVTEAYEARRRIARRLKALLAKEAESDDADGEEAPLYGGQDERDESEEDTEEEDEANT
jgi:DNA-directed RNA polymerase specialized sigma24 family protein